MGKRGKSARRTSPSVASLRKISSYRAQGRTRARSSGPAAPPFVVLRFRHVLALELRSHVAERGYERVDRRVRSLSHTQINKIRVSARRPYIPTHVHSRKNEDGKDANAPDRTRSLRKSAGTAARCGGGSSDALPYSSGTVPGSRAPCRTERAPCSGSARWAP